MSIYKKNFVIINQILLLLFNIIDIVVKNEKKVLVIK